MNTRKQYNSLDLAKFIAAILIVIIHANPFSTYSSVAAFAFRNIIATVAVPFFFVTSGFLFCVKLNTLPSEDKSSYFRKYFLRLLTMYLLWSAVYFIFVLTDWIRNGFTSADLLIYIRDFFFEGSYSTIWFLPALMTAVTIVYFLKKKFTYFQIFLMALPFYLFACLGSSYYGLTKQIPLISDLFNVYYSFFDTIKNGVLFGFVYVALGGIFSENTEKLILPIKKSILWIVVFFATMATETVGQRLLGWSAKGVDTKLMLLPLSFFIFSFVLSINCKSKSVYIWMRKLSLMMFLSQRIFLSLFDIFLNDTIFVQNSVIYFSSILGLTLLFSFAFIKLSDKIKVLKMFY